MRKRSQHFKRMPHGVWSARGQFIPTFVHDQQHAIGAEYQHYGVAADGSCVFAGVTRHAGINRAIARQVFRVWARWRREYDGLPENIGREYPAKHAPTVARIVMFPIDDPKMAQSFEV